MISISFSQSFTVVQFGLALSIMSPVADMATVNLYEGPTLVLSTSFGSLLEDSFTEGLFSYTGAYVNGITIAPDSTDAAAFALDNLLVSTPEPSTFSMLAGAILAGAGIFKLRKRV